jgi:multidrug efflux pump subunit AcrB
VIIALSWRILTLTAIRAATTLNVPISSVFDTLQSYLGTNYVNDFNFLGRTYQVNLQGDSAFRSDPNEILRMYTRNSTGGMV